MTPLPGLAALRRAHGWSIGELAARSGVSETTIGRIERGITTAPRPRVVHRLAAALGVISDAVAELRADVPALPLAPAHPRRQAPSVG